MKKIKLSNGMMGYYRNVEDDLWALTNVASGKEYLPWALEVEGGSWLDIGANIGAFGMLVHKQVDNVICIEPSKENCRVMAMNFTENNIANCFIEHGAVGELDLLYKHHGQHMSYSTMKRVGSFEKVPLIDLYDFEFDYVKCDAEGIEEWLIINHDFSGIRMLIMEWHHNIVPLSQQIKDKLSFMFRQVDYMPLDKVNNVQLIVGQNG